MTISSFFNECIGVEFFSSTYVAKLVVVLVVVLLDATTSIRFSILFHSSSIGLVLL